MSNIALRSIDPAPYVTSPPPAPRDTGPAPMLQWVQVSQLRVDPSYQRDITPDGRRSILSIIRSFDWRRFAPVVVAPVEGGLYAVIDGQHRATAAAALGIEQVPCQVVIADRRAQADAFAAINGGATKVSTVSLYHARVAAGDPEALAVAEVCEAAEVIVLRSNRVSSLLKRGETVAPAALFEGLRRHGRDTLITSLQCITQTSDGNPGCINRPTVAALGAVLSGRPDWRDRGGALLDAFDDYVFSEEANEARKEALGGGLTLQAALAARVATYLAARIGGEA